MAVSNGIRQRLKRFSPQAGIDAGIKPETARLADHHLSYWGSRRCLCVSVVWGWGGGVVCFERLWQVGKIPSKSSRCKLTVCPSEIK